MKKLSIRFKMFVTHYPQAWLALIDSLIRILTFAQFCPNLERKVGKIDLLEKKIEDMLSMIDGAYEIIELWGYHSESSSQKEWAKYWLEKARKYGASPE